MRVNSVLKKEVNLLPVNLQESMAAFFIKLDEKISQEQKKLIYQVKVSKTIVHVFCCSQFIRDKCQSDPQVLVDLIQTEDLFSDQRRQDYQKIINIENIKTEAILMKQLRQFRNREMIRIAWRDLAGWAELDETLRDLTALAEACIQNALDYLYEQACVRHGVPLLNDGTAMNVVILGMGKLGAWELNYSSDIDLIFAYAEDGVLSDRKETTYGEFFTRICRSLVKVLDEITIDGFVFRTDVRLRPFGDSGPIIMTFDGMENYYMTQAREWERYAMIKSRQIAGDFKSGNQLAAMIKPFVYRRYLDYGAFEELRSLKSQITQELQRKDRMENVKLGPGGIREIEFIGQAFQLIRGGQEPELQQREILKILLVLNDLRLMASDDVERLRSAYAFLRRVENHIQQYQDKQTHDLPSDPRVQSILAHSMEYSDWISFKQALDKVREGVHVIFEDVFSLSEEEKGEQKSYLIWKGGVDDELILEYLGEYGFTHCGDTLSIIKHFKNTPSVSRMSAKGIGILNRLIPAVIETVQQNSNQDETLRRILVLFEAVVGRNVYLSLLAENEDALNQLVTLASASPWICEYLALYPILFDELLDARSLYEPLKKQNLEEQLVFELEKIDCHDEEQIMIGLRQFKHLSVLRVAAADIMGSIPVVVVSDYLTYIAEVILDKVLDQAWQMLVNKHGCPPDTKGIDKGIAILGLGKLGGLELGYGSDLDMVFLYGSQDANALTDGNKPIGCTQFYIRLGQKVRHILDTKMLSGQLYEVDLRLRPSGDSGLLVTHINSYENYLRNEAWTWEHQALVRGRFIAGDIHLQYQFEDIRQRVLALPRKLNDLKKEVREMREKMRVNLEPKDSSVFNLKHSKGGIADIEFIVQFGILANTSKNEDLATYTDNIRLLDGLTEYGFISKDNAELLKDAYCQYRDYGHRQVLQRGRAEAGGDDFLGIRANVEGLWHAFMD
ncbi:MAG: bifunctional [glutamate--ammonia ligase]-adenylyl-L-tyrosine phosphorylase/[glutamate--ammonia-ligase] adenylyltransferase [Methylococcales bacterium]|nr:bifunctional [glutamate--ammonia ligase]-adenylyl-L-tyrosine phosphorylase/[glutamate--ammonia-ligase] adenylyltransferase [Methylococcales bacterium]